MEIIFLILLILFVFIVPVVLTAQMRRVANRIEMENNALSGLIEQLEPLIKQLAANAKQKESHEPVAAEPELPVEKMKETISAASQQAAAQQAANQQAARAVPPPLTVAEEELSEQGETIPLPPPPPPAPAPAPVPEFYAATEESPEPQGRNMEKVIGENLMNKIGILALITGIGFFVKFAIDNDWVNEVGRTIIGLCAGMGLWAIAYVLRDRYRSFSSVLAGGGFAICFVTIAVAYNFYELFSSGTTFGIFIGLTAAMIGIALRFDRRELAMTGFIGGFVAPFLAVGDTNSCVMLFGYITILNAGIFLITLRRNWWELAAAGCVLTWTVAYIYTVTEQLTTADSTAMLCFATLFVVLFSIPLATVLNRNTRRSVLFFFLLGAAALNFTAYLILGLHFIAAVPVMCRIRGIIPFVAGGINLLLFYKFYRGRTDMLMQNLLLFAVVVFATLVTPIQFSNPSVIAVSFAVLTLTFTGVYGMTRRWLFSVAAAVLSVVAVITLVSSHPASIYSCNGYSSVWTYALSGLCFIAMSCVISMKWEAFLKFGKNICRAAYCVSLWAGVIMMCVAAYLLTGLAAGPMEAMTSAMAIVMIALLLVSLYGRNSGYAGWLFPATGAVLFLIWCGAYRPPTAVNEILQWTGALLFVAVMSLQGNRIFHHPRLMGPFSRNGFAIYYSLSASVFTVTAIELMLRSAELTRYYSAGFSVGLIICGAMLMAAGMRYRCRVVRLASIGIFGILLLKLVIYDIWGLPMIGRIVVLILLGAVLLSISFFYQRLRKSIFGADDR